MTQYIEDDDICWGCVSTAIVGKGKHINPSWPGAELKMVPLCLDCCKVVASSGGMFIFVEFQLELDEDAQLAVIMAA
jgi:hypothetical protein